MREPRAGPERKIMLKKEDLSKRVAFKLTDVQYDGVQALAKLEGQPTVSSLLRVLIDRAMAAHGLPTALDGVQSVGSMRM